MGGLFKRGTIIVVFIEITEEKPNSKILADAAIVVLIVNAVGFAVHHASGRQTTGDVP